jgi:hypothetical protein
MLPDKYTEVKFIVYLSIIRMKCPRSPTKVVGHLGCKIVRNGVRMFGASFESRRANRLAHHYFLKQINGVPSVLAFLYFVNADDMLGPMSEEEWRGAVRLIHAVLGLPKDLSSYGVFDAFLDARPLQDAD